MPPDRIYLTCYTGYFVPDEPGGSLEDLERHLLAINGEDGKVLWKKAVPAKLARGSSNPRSWLRRQHAGRR